MAAQHSQPLEDIQQIGTGKFGKVYKLYDKQNDRMLAVKKIDLGPVNSDKIAQEVDQLKLEVSMMEKLDHQRIVRYIRHEMQTSMLCIYMEHMPGGSVKDQLKHGAFDEETTKRCTKQILEGLSYLHGKGIIHRDVKGSNILCDGEHKRNIKLCDFGLSKQMRHIQTMSGNSDSKGTPHWMAPEVIEGKDYGRRADIWSTGATIVEMLTTHPPWHQLETFAAMFKIGSLKKADYDLNPSISADAKVFLALTFQPEEKERPRPDDLLKHSWLQI